MAEHRVKKDNIIYIIPTDELFEKWENDEAFIDEYGRLMNRKPHRVLKELKLCADDSLAEANPDSPIKAIFRDKLVEVAEVGIDRGVDAFVYKVLPDMWHRHIVPFYSSIKEALTTKELKIDRIKRQETELKAANAKKTSTAAMTKEEADEEKRKLLYHWLGLLSSLKKLQSAGELDAESTLEQLTEPMMIERVNAFLNENPNLLETDKYNLLHNLLGRNLYEDGQFIPIEVAEIEMVAMNNGGF